MTASSVALKPARPKLTETLQALGRPRVALMAALGFASGLPFMLTAGTLGYWLRDEGVSLKAIGFLAWVGLAYSLKYLWSPVVDQMPAPLLGRLGQRRGWMLLTQLALAVGLVAMALTGPKAGLVAVGIAAVFVAFASATQDIAIDAIRIEAAETPEELGLFTGAFQLGYRIAILVADAGILFAAQHLGWPAAYGLMAVFMGVGIWATFAVREPARAAIRREATADRLSRLGFWQFTVFLALAALGLTGLLRGLVVISWLSPVGATSAELVIALLLLVPFGVISMRRCHDRSRSAWFLILGYLPVLGALGWAAVGSEPGLAKAWTGLLAAMGLAAGQGATAVKAVSAIGLLWLVVDLGLLSGSREANRFGPPPVERPWLTVLWRTVEPVLGPAVAFGRAHGMVAVLMLMMIILYRLPEFVMGPMATPFYHDLGFSKDFVGSVRLSAGLCGTLAGMSLGGFLAASLGYARGLVIGGLLQALAIASFALPALFGPDPRLFAGVMFMDNFGVGAAGVALVTYMSSLTSLGYTATQYAFMSSAYTWIGKTAKGFTGSVVDSLHAHGHSLMQSYAIFFACAGAIGLPAILLCVWLAFVDPRSAASKSQTA